MSQETISLVVPCYNEEATIEIFYHEVLKYEKQIPAQLEFCFVDDGSSDRTIAILRKLAAQDSRVHYVSFSRNFGKEAGLYAGLELATGDYVATMDVDLQDPPYLLPEMYRIVKEEGYDCVATKRSTRKGEPVVRSFFARMFYRIINRMSDTEIVDGARDYRFMSRQMVNAIIEDGEYNRFSKGIFSWVGFNTKWLSYENIERSAGQTKWSFWGLFKYSIEGILAYSTVPLYISSFIGVALFILSIIAFIFIIIKKLVWGDPVQGWASMVCILLFLGGIILLCLGIIGLYVSKIYLETKKRQIYIVKEKK
jgi:glycosyltransferase involved in cell wall biosynthesis